MSALEETRPVQSLRRYFHNEVVGDFDLDLIKNVGWVAIAGGITDAGHEMLSIMGNKVDETVPLCSTDEPVTLFLDLNVHNSLVTAYDTSPPNGLMRAIARWRLGDLVGWVRKMAYAEWCAKQKGDIDG